MDTHHRSHATAITELQGTAEQGRLVLAEVLERIEAAFPAAARRHRLGPGAWLVPLADGAGRSQGQGEGQGQGESQGESQGAGQGAGQSEGQSEGQSRGGRGSRDGSMLIAIAPAGRPRDRGNAQLVLSATVLGRAGIGEADAARALGCLEGVPFTALETDTFTKQLPLLAGLAERVKDKPLGECGVVVVGHLLSDLVVQAQTLIALGARPEAMTVLKKEYPYKLRSRVEAYVAGLGVAVFPVADAEMALRLHVARVSEPSVVIDDGGHVLPTLMRSAAELLPHFRGLVEQSMAGIEELEDICHDADVPRAAPDTAPDSVADSAPTPVLTPVPVFSVAQSAVKRGIDAHWIAETVMRTVRDVVPMAGFDSVPALVIGFGTVGQRVAAALRGHRMRVAVHDTEWRRLVAAHEAGYLTAPDLPALLDGHRPVLIVCATGRTGLRGEDLDFLPGECFVVNVSGRASEIDMPGLAVRAGQIDEVPRIGTRYELPNGAVTVLADGLPVNLPRGDRIPARQSDLTLAAVVWGACAVARDPDGFGAGIDAGRADASIAESGLVEQYYRLYGPDR